VMHQCGAQIVFILMYVIVLGYFVIGVIYQAMYGNIKSVLVEAAIAMVVDQIKSIVTHTITYWVVIRRLGRFGLS
jgi:hypothetical protein